MLFALGNCREATSLSTETLEKIEMQGIVYALAGKIDIEDMPLEVFVAQAFHADIDEHGLIQKNGALGRARITIEVLPS